MPEAKTETKPAAPQSEIAGSLVSMTKQQAMVMLESVYLWMDMGKFDNARELALGTCQLMPKSEVPQIALGTLEFNTQKYDKALQAFRTAQRLAPKAALPRAHCGEALQAMGKYGEAMKELIGAVESEPGSEGAQFATAVMIIVGTRQFDAGKLEDAVKTMQTTVKHAPNDPLAYAHLGKSLLALGKTDEGNAALKKAIELDPNGDDGEAGKLARILMEAAKPEAPAKSTLKAKK